MRLSNSRHDISGLPYKDKQKYRAVIYSDRGVYRPGDTVRLAAVLRTPEHKAPPADMPAELQLRDARNRLVRKIDVRTNEVGQIEVNFPLGDFADTHLQRSTCRGRCSDCLLCFQGRGIRPRTNEGDR